MLTNLNTTYISKPLAEKISHIREYAVTTVVAPIGYGKSRAVGWWAEQQAAQAEKVLILQQVIVSDLPEAFWHGFCRNLRQWPEFYREMEALGFPTDAQSRQLMLELLSDFRATQPGTIFYILDDLHFLPSSAFSEFLLFLSEHLPEKIHLILLSRNVIFNEAARMKLGPRLWELHADDLRLNREGVMDYARRSGILLDHRQADMLAGTTEGWFSMIYLQLRAYLQSGRWPENTTNIYPLIDEVLMQPLTDRQRAFLVRLGIPEDFVEEEAAFLWGEGDAVTMLHELAQRNAFVTCTDGVYRYHNMLRSCAREKFSRLPEEEKRKILYRLGRWYEKEENCFYAETCYNRCQAWDELLRTFFSGQAQDITGGNQDQMISWYQSCPRDAWVRNPDAQLVMLRKLFSFGRIAEMQKMRTLLLETMEERTDLTREEKNNYLGEMELNMSFLTFNDISAMSQYHRRACELMTRPVVGMQGGNWTFGSPSIMLLYHRTPGELDRENGEMRECMPYFYQVTDGHGFGAEHVMQGETEFYRCNLVDAELQYRLAVEKARSRDQISVWLAADCLKVQMELYQGNFEQAEAILRRQEELIRKSRRYVLLHTVELCRAWVFSVLDRRGEDPQWLRNEAAVSPMMRPAAAAVELVRSQELLARHEWATVAAREEIVLAACQRYKGMLLGSILAELQLTAAYEQMGKKTSARNHLRLALKQALPDGLLMPFIFASSRVGDSLVALKGEFPEISKILKLAHPYQEAKGRILRERFTDSSLQQFDLTEREMEIARMTAQRKTRREIGEALGISEKTVSNRLTTIYEKLGLEGQTRNKREALMELMEDEDL